MVLPNIKLTPSSRSPHPVHISLQSMPSTRSSSLAKSVALEESDDTPLPPPRSPTPLQERVHTPFRQRSSSGSSRSSSSSSSRRSSSSRSSWKDLICLPLLPLAFLRTTPPSTPRPSRPSSPPPYTPNSVPIRINIQTPSEPTTAEIVLPALASPDLPSSAPIHGTLIAVPNDNKGKARARERSSLLAVGPSSPGHSGRMRPPSWVATIPIALDTN